VRLRIRFVKLGRIRFTSHRDVARMWERAVRRVDLPVARTEGFSPRPRLAFGLALSTGHESLAEYLDVELLEQPETFGRLASLPSALSDSLPEGIDVTAVAPLAPGEPSLQESVVSCSWRIEALGVDVPTAQRLSGALLAADQLVSTRIRKGREVTDDLRPAVLRLSVTGPTAAGVELDAELAVHPRSLRPAELLLALSPDGALGEGRVLRTAQWTRPDGARREPLATSGPPREDLHDRDRTRAPDPAFGGAPGDTGRPAAALRG
jgi:radical SAM-linked protein